MAASVAASLASILAVVGLLGTVAAQPVGQLGGWVDARATYYGTDAWSIHTGECGFGYICPQRWTGGPQGLAEGWDVAAISDRSNLDTGSQCGTCLEVKCRDAVFKDGYGNTMDRVGMCLNGDSVKVKIVDLCPCNYPANAYSNKEWCCGDMPHLDMSAWAIEKIVQDHTRWGVFGISYRTIPCDMVLSNPAPQIANPVADPHANLKPAGLDCNTQGPQGVQTYVAAPAVRATARKTTKPKVHHHTWAYYHTKHHHTPTYYANLKKHKSGRRMLLASSQPDAISLQQPTERVYIHHQESEWTAALTGLAGWTSKSTAPSDLLVGKKAVCCTAPTQGSSCGFMGPAGVADSASMLGFYYQRQSSQEVKVSVSLIGTESVCDGPVIESIGEPSTTSVSDWAYYKVPLSQIIDGCTDRSEVNGVAFTNQGSEPVSFCVDRLSLL